MKPMTPLHLALVLPTALLVGFFLSPAPLTAQVKIPAKSGSSLDNPETGTGAKGVPQPSRSKIKSNSNVSRTIPPGPSELKENKVVPPKPGAVTATQRVAMPKQNLDPKRMKRLAELRRELRVIEAATQAQLALPADDIFEKTAPTTIDDLAEPTLKKVVEFLELTDMKKVTVNTFYVREQEGGKHLAWTRSLALIEWMTSNSSLELENFKAAGPAPVLKPTLRKTAKNPGESDFKNRIELHLE